MFAALPSIKKDFQVCQAMLPGAFQAAIPVSHEVQEVAISCATTSRNIMEHSLQLFLY